jgi:hypothetical protein
MAPTVSIDTNLRILSPVLFEQLMRYINQPSSFDEGTVSIAFRPKSCDENRTILVARGRERIGTV